MYGSRLLCFLILIYTGNTKVGAENTAVPVSINHGDDFHITLKTFGNDVVGCFLDTPFGETIEFIPEDKSGDRYELRDPNAFSGCNVNVKTFSSEDNGVWRIFSVFETGVVAEQSYDVTVNVPDIETTPVPDTTPEAETTPEYETIEVNTDQPTPAVDTIEIIYLNEEIHTVALGEEVQAIIHLVGYRETDSCKITTPNNVEYEITLTSELEGVDKIEGSHISCAVSIKVTKEDLIGEWILVARESSMGADGVERRLPFTINVEETVKTSPDNALTIKEGTDFYIRLQESTEAHETCNLISPTGTTSRIERDPALIQFCGYIVKNVEKSDIGVWEIQYGDKIKYRAFVNLNVEDSTSSSIVESIVLTKNLPVHETIGPQNAVYCQLQDPTGFVVYEDFGACQLIIHRPAESHEGLWELRAGLPGRMLTESYQFTVSVVDSEIKPKVSVNVEKVDRIVYMTCRVSTPHEIKTCKFRDPSGRIFLANPGLGESGYSFHGAGTSLESGLYNHECGLRIDDPSATDLGIWRCAIESDAETYFGFLTVLCPWALQDPVIAANVVSEPILTATREDVKSVVGDQVTLSCKVASPIRYCYFRARNGSIFNVYPDIASNTFHYSGAGFDSGECGITIVSPFASDSGSWSCHVGFLDSSAAEQKAMFTLTVQERLVARQIDEGNTLYIEGQVHDNQAVEYCRYVRIDGLGFMSDSLPSNIYTTYGSQLLGLCGLRVTSPTILDHHPWTVVVKIQGHEEEISAETVHTLDMPSIDTEEIKSGRSKSHYFHCIVLPILIVFSVILIVALNRRSRNWTKERVVLIRDSFRRSLTKKPLPETPYDEKNTATAA